jgi:hypothetical protein
VYFSGIYRTQEKEAALVTFGISGRVQMDRVEWKKKVTDELQHLAPNKQAMKHWVESQNFKIYIDQGKPEGSWWFEAENENMAFSKIIVRWDVNKKPTLKVTVA